MSNPAQQPINNANQGQVNVQIQPSTSRKVTVEIDGKNYTCLVDGINTGNEADLKKIAKQATKIALQISGTDFKEADIVLGSSPSNLDTSTTSTTSTSSTNNNSNKEVKLVFATVIKSNNGSDTTATVSGDQLYESNAINDPRVADVIRRVQKISDIINNKPTSRKNSQANTAPNTNANAKTNTSSTTNNTKVNIRPENTGTVKGFDYGSITPLLQNRNTFQAKSGSLIDALAHQVSSMKNNKYSEKKLQVVAKELRENYIAHIDNKRNTIKSSDTEFKEILDTLKVINKDNYEKKVIINIMMGGNGYLGKFGNTINSNYNYLKDVILKKELNLISADEVKLVIDVYKEYINKNGAIVSENSFIGSFVEKNKKKADEYDEFQVFINNGNNTRHYPVNEDEIKFGNCAFLEIKNGMFRSYIRIANNNMHTTNVNANSDLDTKKDVKLLERTTNNASKHQSPEFDWGNDGDSFDSFSEPRVVEIKDSNIDSKDFVFDDLVELLKAWSIKNDEYNLRGLQKILDRLSLVSANAYSIINKDVPPEIMHGFIYEYDKANNIEGFDNSDHEYGKHKLEKLGSDENKAERIKYFLLYHINNPEFKTACGIKG